MPRPMLDGVELEQVQKVDAEDQEVLAQHGVPGLEGDFLQDLGRRATRLSVMGVVTGADAGEQLKTLREKFRSATPVPFVDDIAVATKVDKVLIEEFGAREVAGKPARFEFELTLREFLPPPKPEQEEPPPPPPPPPEPEVDTGTLEVEVIVEGQPNFDFGKVTVSAVKLNADGSRPSQTLTNRTGNVWTEEKIAIGDYTIDAVVTDPPPMSGSTSATVRAGQTTRAQITLVRAPIIAKSFVVHFRFDNAFLEPCMREVLQKVAEFAGNNSSDKLVVVGNTDEVGSPGDLTASDPYNQSLSERRARSAFGYSTFKTDATTSMSEWNALRQKQTGITTLGDKWSTRQYQYMLQALGFYPGNIDGDHGPLTSDAVRSFREAKGLPVGTTVDDPVWEALIADYLAQDNNTAPTKFLPNKSDGCDGGDLKWFGIASQDPVKNVRSAFRPNRRVELLFVNTDKLPCGEPQPDTFNLPSVGAVNSTWCLGPGNPRSRTCFAVKHLPPGGQPQGNQWLRQPAEPGSVIVRGEIKFEDGSPAGNVKYVLIAPDGEFMDGERSNGEGVPARTRADGTFEYANQKGIGTYTLEIQDPLIARLEGEPQSAAKGTVVCKRMDGTSPFNVVVRRLTTDVNPTITPATSVVLVKKTYTNPARQLVTLGTDGPFFRSGTLTRTGAAIRFFDALVNGTEITFNGTDNKFTGSRLTAGVQLFAESTIPSLALDDVQLTLTLTPGATPIGPSAAATMTAVELTLDVALSRLAAGVDPPLMPQPPAVVPAPGAATDKVNLGRSVQVRDPGFSHERAMLIIQPPNPATFAGTLLLTPITAQVQTFNNEVPAAGQAPLTPPPFPVPGPIPVGGTRVFVDTTGVSNAVRDTGFQLGIQGGQVEGDRVAMTAVQFDSTQTATGAAAASPFERFGLWDHAFDPVTGALLNGATDATHFIGADSRRFFFRLRDVNAGAAPQLQWRTVNADGTNDHAPAAQPLPLQESVPGSRLFFSRPVFAVTDNDDRDLVLSGLAAAAIAPLRPRIRKVTIDDTHPIDGRLAATYSPAAGQIMRNSAFWFRRIAEERRRMRVHLVDVRSAVGGAGTLTAARRNLFKQVCRSIYGVCGIFVDFDEFQIDPPAACIAWTANYPGDPLAINPAVEGFTLPAVNLVPSATQLAIVNAVRARPGHVENDLYLVFVQRIYRTPVPAPPGPLVQGSRGESFPDSWVAAGAVTRGFTFVGLRGGVTNTTETHELTHMTTNLRNSVGGHFDIGDPRDTRNLMHNGTIDNGCLGTKRLWNTAFNNAAIAPSAIPAQIDTIRASRFVHPF